MEKYRYRWPFIIGVSLLMWAGIVYAVKADGIRDAAIYIVDSRTCALRIDPRYIELALVTAMRERNMDLDTAASAAKIAGDELQAAIEAQPFYQVIAYCRTRVKK